MLMQIIGARVERVKKLKTHVIYEPSLLYDLILMELENKLANFYGFVASKVEVELEIWIIIKAVKTWK